MSIERIGVVGAGQMGAGIAQVAAQAGFSVVVTDVDDERLQSGRIAIDKSLTQLVASEKLSRKDAADTLERIDWATDVAEHANQDFVIEAASEDKSVKEMIFRQLDGSCRKETILASNTSSIPITYLATMTSRPEHVIGMHFMNPVPIMPLVEIVCSSATTESTFVKTKKLAEQMEKTTIRSEDAPGFIANRVLMPMINEAFFALDEGVGSAEDIDTTLQLGMRHPMGPLALADLIGLDTCQSILDVMHRDLGDPKFRPCPLLRAFVSDGKLGRKSGEGVYTYED